jgi:hypothetical protein
VTVDSSNGSVSIRTADDTYGGFDRLYLGAGCFGTSEILMRTFGIRDDITVKDNNSYVFPIFYTGGGISNGDHSEYISITNTILGVVPKDETAIMPTCIFRRSRIITGDTIFRSDTGDT